MTVYDGVMALIVLYTVVTGYFRGAAWQIAPILSLVMGYAVAMPMSVTMAQYFGPPPLNRLFALVAIYILVAITVYLMVRSFREGVEKAKLTELDRHFGAILGGVKGLLITLVTTCVFLIYFPQMREVILQSESSSIAAKMIGRIYPILPSAMHTILNPYLKLLEDQVPIEMEDPGDGFQGSGGKPAPRANPPANPSPSADESPFRLQPTATLPDLPPARPTSTARRQLRSNPEPIESDPEPPPQPPRRRPVLRSAQEDDPFEAANPDRVSPPQ